MALTSIFVSNVHIIQYWSGRETVATGLKPDAKLVAYALTSRKLSIRPRCFIYIYMYLYCTSFANYTSWNVVTGDKELRPSTPTLGLHSNAEFQPRESPIWPPFLVSNCHIYVPMYIGHVFGHQSPLSSCVVREACTSYTPACITLTMYLFYFLCKMGWTLYTCMLLLCSYQYTLNLMHE